MSTSFDIEAARHAQLNRQAEQAARDLAASFGFDIASEPDQATGRTPVKRKSKTAHDDHSTSKSRVLIALRAAGKNGIRTDALRTEAKCSHPGGRICDLREEGYTITDVKDAATRLCIYTLVSEAG